MTKRYQEEEEDPLVLGMQTEEGDQKVVHLC